MNLGTNAIQAMGAGGTLLISLESLDITRAARDDDRPNRAG